MSIAFFCLFFLNLNYFSHIYFLVHLEVYISSYLTSNLSSGILWHVIVSSYGSSLFGTSCGGFVPYCGTIRLLDLPKLINILLCFINLIYIRSYTSQVCLHILKCTRLGCFSFLNAEENIPYSEV